jgi:hypothetical protein
MVAFGLVRPNFDELAHKRHTRMRVNNSAGSGLIKRNSRRTEKRAKRAAHTSFSTDSFIKKVEVLQADATRGDYQSQLRLEAINKLINPCLEFSESDVQRIINKDYPPQVERGLGLYRLMSRLIILCEPIGDAVGAASRVRLINFEDLTWSEFLDLKAHTTALISRLSDKRITSEQFNGLELLKSEEKDLYERAKRYFGGKKRPTLKSLALDLLGEDDKVCVDRSVSNHIAAVREFREKHKDELGFSWYFVGGVDSYNKNPKSGREFHNESVASMRKAARELFIPNYSKAFAQMVAGVNDEMLRSAKIFGQMAMSLPSLNEQREAIAKLVADAAYAAAHIPQITLPKIYFSKDFM